MILVEVYFKELNQLYDVQMDESIPIGSLMDSLVELIAQKEHLKISQNPGLFILCDLADQRILHPSTTLAENGICSGHRLFLL